ncbi:MAG: type III-A CRISPR-associated RAMP protein Csm3, partial [Deltaproteobacteria bacterium]|nr:type III-A CRISPR-associated RAMP protein Csm3 [Deltaproteobacteria bacterium]
MDAITLNGKVVIEGTITAVTGLHIGGAATGIEIGGIDLVVARNSMNNQPYIPGSSLKGKMRSLLEKLEGKKQNKFIRKEPPVVRHHECENKE